MKKFEVFGLQTLGEIQPGDNLPKMIIDSAENEIGPLQAGARPLAQRFLLKIASWFI